MRNRGTFKGNCNPHGRPSHGHDQDSDCSIYEEENEKSNSLYKKFDNIILILILVSSVMLPMDNPLKDPNSRHSMMLSGANVLLTFCFLCEAIIKIIAKGLFFNNLGHVQPYLSSGWNRVDFFVVSISVIDVIMKFCGGGKSLAALKSLRALRALRPLRVIKRFESLRIVVNCLFSTMVAI